MRWADAGTRRPPAYDHPLHHSPVWVASVCLYCGDWIGHLFALGSGAFFAPLLGSWASPDVGMEGAALFVWGSCPFPPHEAIPLSEECAYVPGDP